MKDKTEIDAWRYEDNSNSSDAQLDEIKQQQAVAGASKNAQKAYGDALAKEVQANMDFKTENEQLGKEPWERWYSHPIVGRGGEKGIADILFLSIFGYSSATDTKRTRFQRAAIRTVLTIVVIYITSLVWSYLIK
jgi:hypothetical protein